MLDRLKVNSVTAGLARAAGQWATRNVESFIFVFSTGRCGTTSLKHIFDAVPSCAANHEPHPQPFGSPMEAFNEGNEAPLRRLFVERKLPNIYWASRNARTYFESSLLFGFTFDEMAYEAFGRRLKVVFLRRDPIATASSYYWRGQDPMVDPWLPRPYAPRNVVDIPQLHERGGAFDDRFFRLIWLCYEVMGRAWAFHRSHPDVAFVPATLDDLNDIQAILRIMEQLNVHHDAGALREIVGTRANSSPRTPTFPEHIDEGAVQALQAMCRRCLVEKELIDPGEADAL